uniref:HNH endonuclease n=1 Tax=viral metagenome TaxID=1070528 RepID=A0A6M3JMP2_9ZZZZ
MTRCVLCPNPASEAHHFITRARGGTLTVPLCSRCHKEIHRGNRTVIYLLTYWLRARGYDTDIKYILRKLSPGEKE